MKLKTLKDLNTKETALEGPFKVIKAEAIEWVKNMLIKAQKDEKWINIAKEYIKFFNITEEDLK